MNNKAFKFKVGDKVKIVQLDKRDIVDIAFKIDEELTIERRAHGYYGNIYFFIDKEYGLYEKQLKALEKVEMPKYCKVNKENKSEYPNEITPKFKIGDKVRYVKNDGATNKRFKLGEIFTISDFWFNTICDCMTYWFEEKDIYGLNENQLELVKEDKKEEIEVGDTVEVTFLYSIYQRYFNIGEILTVTQIHSYEKTKVYWFAEKPFYHSLPEDSIRLVKKKKVEEPKKHRDKIVEEEAIITCTGKTTEVNIDGKIGKARCSDEDKFDAKKGMLIATARAVGYKEDMILELVKVLFDEKTEDNKPQIRLKAKLEFPKENTDFETDFNKDYESQWFTFEI